MKKLIIAAIAVFVLCGQAQAFQSEIVLYKNSQYALTGPATGATWHWPGTALTANTSFIRADMAQRTVVSARWLVVWNPSTSNSPTGVRLVKCDTGPSNIEQIGRITRTYTTTPVVDVVDITTEMQDIVDAGLYKVIGHQTFGNGVNSGKIYGSWIEIVWDF